MKTKLKMIETEHDVKSEDDVKTALFAHQHAARDAGLEPATQEQPVHLEVVSLKDGKMTIRTSTEEPKSKPKTCEKCGCKLVSDGISWVGDHKPNCPNMPL